MYQVSVGNTSLKTIGLESGSANIPHRLNGQQGPACPGGSEHLEFTSLLQGPGPGTSTKMPATALSLWGQHHYSQVCL